MEYPAAVLGNSDFLQSSLPFVVNELSRLAAHNNLFSLEFAGLFPLSFESDRGYIAIDMT